MRGLGPTGRSSDKSRFLEISRAEDRERVASSPREHPLRVLAEVLCAQWRVSRRAYLGMHI